MEQTIHKPLQRQSPLVTEEVMNQLIDRGLVNGPKFKLRQLEAMSELPPYSLKEGTFARTVFDILKEVDKPINRVELVCRAIQINHPQSKNPLRVYHNVIGKLEKKGVVFIDRSHSEKVERHIVSLA